MIYKMKNVPLNLQSTFIDTLFDPFKYLLSVKRFVRVALLAKRLTAESSARCVAGNFQTVVLPFQLSPANVNPGKVARWDSREWVATVCRSTRLFSQSH